MRQHRSTKKERFKVRKTHLMMYNLDRGSKLKEVSDPESPSYGAAQLFITIDVLGGNMFIFFFLLVGGLSLLSCSG